MLTNQEIILRINRWAKRHPNKMPVCGHHESHGQLKPAEFSGEILLACTKCDYLELTRRLPYAAFRKIS